MGAAHAPPSVMYERTTDWTLNSELSARRRRREEGRKKTFRFPSGPHSFLILNLHLFCAGWRLGVSSCVSAAALCNIAWKLEKLFIMAEQAWQNSICCLLETMQMLFSPSPLRPSALLSLLCFFSPRSLLPLTASTACK